MTTPILARPAPATRPALVVLAPRPATLPVDQPPLPVDEHDDDLVSASPELSQEEQRVADLVVRGLAETLAGRRPLAQLRPLLAPRVALLMEHLVRGGAARGMRLARARAQGPAEGVLEVAARLTAPSRCVAFAARIERRPTRWTVTVLEAGLAPDGRRPARS